MKDRMTIPIWALVTIILGSLFFGGVTGTGITETCIRQSIQVDIYGGDTPLSCDAVDFLEP